MHTTFIWVAQAAGIKTTNRGIPSAMLYWLSHTGFSKYQCMYSLMSRSQHKKHCLHSARYSVHIEPKPAFCVADSQVSISQSEPWKWMKSIGKRKQQTLYCLSPMTVLLCSLYITCGFWLVYYLSPEHCLGFRSLALWFNLPLLPLTSHHLLPSSSSVLVSLPTDTKPSYIYC